MNILIINIFLFDPLNTLDIHDPLDPLDTLDVSRGSRGSRESNIIYPHLDPLELQMQHG